MTKTKLSKVLDGLVKKKKSFEYKHHTEWGNLEAQKAAMKVFEAWYAENNNKIKHYNHPRHAFNWLCKHYKLITITSKDISIEGQKATLWTLKSFYETNQSKTWIYHEMQDLVLVAIIDSTSVQLKDESLKKHSWFLKNICV